MINVIRDSSSEFRPVRAVDGAATVAVHFFIDLLNPVEKLARGAVVLVF
jgi:hypothetical protein